MLNSIETPTSRLSTQQSKSNSSKTHTLENDVICITIQFK